MKRFLACIVFVAATLGLSGCGSDDPGTNGQLLLTVLPSATIGGTTFSFVATATYTAPPPPTTTSTPTPTTTTNLSGVPITFTLSANGVTLRTDHMPTNSVGVAIKNYDITESNQAVTVDVTASTGGLSSTQSILVPAAP